MRLTSRKQGQVKMDLSMTSMIDVVFLLLIFFIVTSSFVKTERQLKPAIKVKEKSANSSSGALEPAIVEVMRVGEEAVFKIGGRQLTDAGQLEEVLKAFDNKSDGAFVIVHDDVPFGKAAAAVNACKAAGFLGVSYTPYE